MEHSFTIQHLSAYRYIYSNVFKRNSHAVNVNALNSVVSITAQAVIVPLCPKLRAITKQLPVVALPSITRMAMSFSDRNPIQIAAGRNKRQNNISLIPAIPQDRPIFPFAS